MNIFRPIAPVIRQLAEIYTSRERNFSYGDIKVSVKPGVFHPGLFISTKFLLDFVNRLSLDNKTLLELGAGSGVISILAAKKGAEVSASDISKTSVENIKLNAEMNHVRINVIHSDLFKNIPVTPFDYIIINPPYYRRNPEKEKDYAWYCGSNYDYFRNLFASIKNYLNQNSIVIMILSEVCDIDSIRKIGEENGYSWKIELGKSVWGEKNFIYRLTRL